MTQMDCLACSSTNSLDIKYSTNSGFTSEITWTRAAHAARNNPSLPPHLQNSYRLLDFIVLVPQVTYKTVLHLY